LTGAVCLTGAVAGLCYFKVERRARVIVGHHVSVLDARLYWVALEPLRPEQSNRAARRVYIIVDLEKLME
jgi:hypothetical protein